MGKYQIVIIISINILIGIIEMAIIMVMVMVMAIVVVIGIDIVLSMRIHMIRMIYMRISNSLVLSIIWTWRSITTLTPITIGNINRKYNLKTL
jgi:hypothetical protein